MGAQLRGNNARLAEPLESAAFAFLLLAFSISPAPPDDPAEGNGDGVAPRGAIAIDEIRI